MITVPVEAENQVAQELPNFEYFPDPIGNGCIVAEQTMCPCCKQSRNYVYKGPIYTTHDVSEVCPWCIASGDAAEKWSASFNDILDVPAGVPQHVIETIDARTPGYETWQGNGWLFSEQDALVFVGDVVGTDLVSEGSSEKIEACRKALAEWNIGSEFDLSQVVAGGQPAIYMFQYKDTGAYRCYADMT